MAQSQAPAGGVWIVTGQIDGKPILVECDFCAQGSGLVGSCTDINKGEKPKPGKVHKLSRGIVSGNTVRWTYPVKVMVMSIDINFEGHITGERMSGTIEAKGRQGQFSATRKPA
jgi:hypothetical protein